MQRAKLTLLQKSYSFISLSWVLPTESNQSLDPTPEMSHSTNPDLPRSPATAHHSKPNCNCVRELQPCHYMSDAEVVLATSSFTACLWFVRCYLSMQHCNHQGTHATEVLMISWFQIIWEMQIINQKKLASYGRCYIRKLLQCWKSHRIVTFCFFSKLGVILLTVILATKVLMAHFG